MVIRNGAKMLQPQNQNYPNHRTQHCRGARSQHFTWLHWLMRYPCHTEATDMETQSREGVQLSIVYTVELDKEKKEKKKTSLLLTHNKTLFSMSTSCRWDSCRRWNSSGWSGKKHQPSLGNPSFLPHWRVPTERHFTVLHSTQKAALKSLNTTTYWSKLGENKRNLFGLMSQQYWLWARINNNNVEFITKLHKHSQNSPLVTFAWHISEIYIWSRNVWPSHGPSAWACWSWTGLLVYSGATHMPILAWDQIPAWIPSPDTSVFPQKLEI